jgi:hypothetical protein
MVKKREIYEDVLSDKRPVVLVGKAADTPVSAPVVLVSAPRRPRAAIHGLWLVVLVLVLVGIPIAIVYSLKTSRQTWS